MTNRALIMVDFQNEWTLPESEYYVGDIGPMIEKANRLIECCRGEGDKIIFTKHIELDSSDAFSPDSSNIEILSGIKRMPHDTVITKHKISPYFGTNLEKELVNIDTLVVAGILTNLCVRSLIHDAYDRDLEITVIKDCCVAMNEEIQDFTLKDIAETRPEVDLVDCREFIELSKNS